MVAAFFLAFGHIRSFLRLISSLRSARSRSLRSLRLRSRASESQRRPWADEIPAIPCCVVTLSGDLLRFRQP